MELRHLRAFLVVAEELHFGRAARRLHMSQPPLSQQIKRLEQEVGARLLDRSTREVALTSAGRAFRAEARRALDAVDAACTAARRAERGDTGTIRLGFTGPSSYHVLPALARRFGEDNPGVRLVLAPPSFSGELTGALRDGEIDLGFVRLPVSAPGLTVRTLQREPFVAVLPDRHPLAGADVIDLPELADDPFVAYPAMRGSVLRDKLGAACLTAGFSPRIVQEAPDTHTLVSLVGTGIGVTLLPAAARHLVLEGVRYLPLRDVAIDVPLGMAWREDDPNPALAAFLDTAAALFPQPAA